MMTEQDFRVPPAGLEPAAYRLGGRASLTVSGRVRRPTRVSPLPLVPQWSHNAGTPTFVSGSCGTVSRAGIHLFGWMEDAFVRRCEDAVEQDVRSDIVGAPIAPR